MIVEYSGTTQSGVLDGEIKILSCKITTNLEFIIMVKSASFIIRGFSL